MGADGAVDAQWPVREGQWGGQVIFFDNIVVVRIGEMKSAMGSEGLERGTYTRGLSLGVIGNEERLLAAVDELCVNLE